MIEDIKENLRLKLSKKKKKKETNIFAANNYIYKRNSRLTNYCPFKP